MTPSTIRTTRGAPLSADRLAVLRGMLEAQRAFRVEQLAQLYRPQSQDRSQSQDANALAEASPEITESLRAGARAALRDVQGALGRMDEGTYGLCIQCAAPLDPQRLEVLPQLAVCLSCQPELAATGEGRRS